MSRVLLDTLATVIAELERLDPASLVAARAQGVLEGFRAAPLGTRGSVKIGRPKKAATDSDFEMARLYSDGLTVERVAKHMGVSTGTVRAALRRTGTPARKWRPLGAAGIQKHNEERVERIREMRAIGQTLEEIAAVECITRERVRQLCVKAGIDTQQRPLTPEEAAAVQLYLDGASLDLAAERLGRSAHGMRSLLFRAGHKPRPAPKLRQRSPETIAKAERACEMYRAGFSTPEIAAKLQLRAQPMVYRLLAIGGVKPDRHRKGVRVSARKRPEPARAA